MWHIIFDQSFVTVWFPQCLIHIKYKAYHVEFIIFRAWWSCSPAAGRPSSATPRPGQQSYSVGQPPHTCIPSWTSNPPTAPTAPPLYTAPLPAAGLFIGPVSFPHLQGARVVTVGTQSLSGILHGNENAPRWCKKLILVTFSRRTCMVLFCCGCAAQYVVQR